MKILNREEILNAADRPEMVKVDVPEWSGSVYVKTMTAGERDRYEVAHVNAKGSDPRARLAAATICDENGFQMFAESDIKGLTGRSWLAMNRVIDAAAALNQVNDADIRNLEKNSEANLSAAS